MKETPPSAAPAGTAASPVNTAAAPPATAVLHSVFRVIEPALSSQCARARRRPGRSFVLSADGGTEEGGARLCGGRDTF
ncbi:hypothetical protein CLM83_14900 [Streptomyces albidoflavus]|nr:hypothetical protein CLM83_14900 [Streptomyces albidoflavus]